MSWRFQTKDISYCVSGQITWNMSSLLYRCNKSKKFILKHSLIQYIFYTRNQIYSTCIHTHFVYFTTIHDLISEKVSCIIEPINGIIKESLGSIFIIYDPSKYSLYRYLGYNKLSIYTYVNFNMERIYFNDWFSINKSKRFEFI